MRIACVYTVKNEEELILHNLKYHHFIGVTDFFIFLDHSTDNTKNLISPVPGCRVYEDLKFKDLVEYNLNKPGLDLKLFEQSYSTHFGLRQTLNANMALETCKSENIDWLIHLDSDELIYVNKVKIKRDILKEFFQSIEKDVDAVRFRNLEVVPTKTQNSFVFEDYLFKRDILNGNIPGLPGSRIFNPFTNKYIPAGWFWGHSSGKIALKPGNNSYITTPHECRVNNKIIEKEYLLHYFIYGFKQFLNKFRNWANWPPKKIHGRKIRPLRLLLRDLANKDSLSNDFLFSYYKKHIMYSKQDIETIKASCPNALKEIHSVSEFFRSNSSQS
jgi:hypothetical protein